MLLFTSSIIMVGLGIIGFYLAQIYDEIKGRPELKFALNIRIAYGVARPAAATLLSAYGQGVQDNGAMLVGMCLFVVLNYLGQRFFAFGGKLKDAE